MPSFLENKSIADFECVITKLFLKLPMKSPLTLKILFRSYSEP